MTRTNKRIASLVAASIMALGVASAAATAIREVGGARFSATRVVEGATIEFHNAALFRYLFFDVYVAALYLEPGADPRAALADRVARRLEVVYLRDIAAEDLARAAREVLERNLAPAALAAIEADLERLHGWFRDVREGDRIALTWVPGVGTTLQFNDETLGTVDGAGFARAYFSIWLGDAPIDDGLRAALLASPAAEVLR